MSGTLLPIPDDPRFAGSIAQWPEYQRLFTYPRAEWLGDFEDLLREHYPSANSDSLTLTARTVAPFPLALPGVP